MKKLISLLYLIACTQLMFANLKDLKVGDTFEYRIEDLRTFADRLKVTQFNSSNEMRWSHNFPEKNLERHIKIELNFKVLEINDTSTIFEVRNNNFYFNSREKKNATTWTTIEKHNSITNQPHSRIIKEYPYFSKKKFSIIVSHNDLSVVNRPNQPSLAYSEKMLLRRILCTKRTNSKTFRFKDVDYSLEDSLNNLFQYNNGNEYNRMYNQEYTYKRDEQLPQRFVLKSNPNYFYENPVYDFRSHEIYTEIRKVNKYQPFFKTQYFPKIYQLDKSIDTLITAPNTRIKRNSSENKCK